MENKTKVSEIKKYELRIGGIKGFKHPTEIQVLNAVEKVCGKKGEFDLDIRELRKTKEEQTIGGYETRMELVLDFEIQLGNPSFDNILDKIRQVCEENHLEEYDQEQGQLCYSAKFGMRIGKETIVQK